MTSGGGSTAGQTVLLDPPAGSVGDGGRASAAPWRQPPGEPAIVGAIGAPGSPAMSMLLTWALKTGVALVILMFVLLYT